MDQEMHVIHILQVATGIMLLALGSRLFWVFVGCVGFVAGWQLSQQYFGFEPSWMTWAAALLCGLAGTLLALFFQKLAIVVGGFAAGITIGAHLAYMMGVTSTSVIPILGGIVGAISLFVLFDWALIVLSSVVGSTLVVQSFSWNPQAETVLYLVLIVFGIWFQAALLPVRKPDKK